jgi:catabolite regulation protein CreA
MEDKKLAVIQDNVVEGITCFSIQAKYNVACQRKDCRNWIDHQDSQNCAIIAAQDGPKTLQDVGKIFGLTRMRICQIEKNISRKIKDLY